MVANHAHLAPLVAAKRIDWEPLREAAVQAGATNGRDGVPSDQVMRRTWRKARVHVATRLAEADRASGAAAKPTTSPRPNSAPAARPHEPTPSGMSQALVPVSAPALHSAPLLVETPKPADGTFRLELDENGLLFGEPVTWGPLLPEPDYTGMTRTERIIARNRWHILRRRTSPPPKGF